MHVTRKYIIEKRHPRVLQAQLLHITTHQQLGKVLCSSSSSRACNDTSNGPRYSFCTNMSSGILAGE